MNLKPARPKGVVAVIPDAGRLLVIRRSTLVEAPGTYCFPGGGLLQGESERAAVIREVHEELAVRVVPKSRLWASVTPWQVELAWWLAEIVGAQVCEPNPQEVESVAWLRPDEMRGLPQLLESNRHFLEAWDRKEFELRI